MKPTNSPGGLRTWSAGILRTMSGRSDESSGVLSWNSRRRCLQVECRECEAICQRVVFPYRCLMIACPAVYAYVEEETTYFGCVYKVFAPELDLAAFSFQGRNAGNGRGGEDPYGALRVTGRPREQCPIAVEQAYPHQAEQACVNPAFFHQRGGPAGDCMRLYERSRSTPKNEPDKV